MTDMVHEPEHWPVSIEVDATGFTPRELGLVQKVAGVELTELSGEDQARAATFIGLFRLFPDRDPGVLWEHALDTRMRYVEPESNPIRGDGS